MNGILIINQFLNSNKFKELYRFITDAAGRFNIRLTVMTNADYLVRVDTSFRTCEPPIEACDFVLFWDKDVYLAKAIEESGIRVFNRADAIEICDDKAKTFEALKGRVKMPATYRIPMTFPGIGYTDTGFLNKLESLLSYPYVIKENCGSLGAQVYLIASKADALNILNAANGRALIAQEFISYNSGSDIRIHTVGNRVVTSMIRHNENDFRANISNGGSMLEYTPTEEECEMALACTKLLGLDFAGVDILTGSDGHPILCEVNSNAHFKNIFECTKVNVADAIMEHILMSV